MVTYSKLLTCIFLLNQFFPDRHLRNQLVLSNQVQSCLEVRFTSMTMNTYSKKNQPSFVTTSYFRIRDAIEKKCTLTDQNIILLQF